MARKSAEDKARANAVEGAEENTAAAKPAKGARFEWAANVVKLNRAIATIQHDKPQLKGVEFESAVRDEYVKLAGLVVGNEPAVRRGKAPKEVNMAADDGSANGDDDEDEAE